MNNRPIAIICDRDGTLASVHNGPCHGPVDTGDYSRASKSDWAAFNAALPFDRPVPLVVGLLNAMRPDIVRIVVSGRAEGDWPGDRRRRFAMQDWLYKHQIPYDHLFMRCGGDHRLDSIVKEEILLNDILPRFDPVLAIDDRPQVCDVWKRYGIATIEVANPGHLPFIGEGTL